MHEISTDYKIVFFNEQSAQILVKFDEVPYLIPLDLHVNEHGEYPEGDVLDNFIRSVCPFGEILRMRQIQSGIKNADSIKKLVVDDDSVKHLLPNYAIPDPNMDIGQGIPPTPEEIEALMAEILQNK